MPSVPKTIRQKKKRKKSVRGIPLELWPYNRLLKETDKWFSLYIRGRDKNSCVICGSKIKVQNGHLIRRGKRSIRFNVYNCNAQCSSCNVKHNHYPEHYTQWFINKHGFSKYNELLELSEQTIKHTREELIGIITLCKMTLKNIG